MSNKTKISSCQQTDGVTCVKCNQRSICNLPIKDKVVPEKVVNTRTCPECGFVNNRDALNCERCDYPLQI